MLKNFFRSKKIDDNQDSVTLIACLLVHAAKVDENYTSVEKKIITKALSSLNEISESDAKDILHKAEKKEQDSNQIIEFTREIKKKPMEYRLKIIEILLKIVYSDGAKDDFESNLIRRVCGLLYISNQDSGNLKLKVKSLKTKK